MDSKFTKKDVFKTNRSTITITYRYAEETTEERLEEIVKAMKYVGLFDHIKVKKPK